MNLNLKHFFREYDCLLAIKDGYLGCNTHGIVKIDSQDFSVKQEMLDAFNGQFFFLSYDNQYLIVENMKLGIRVYDVKTLNQVSEYLPMLDGKAYTYGFELSPDQNTFYLIMGETKDASVPPMFPEELVDNSEFSIRCLSFPDLKQKEEIPLKEKIVDLAYLPFMNQYLASDPKGQYYLYDGRKEVTLLPSLKSKVAEATAFSDAKRIVTLSDYGIRLYDSNLVEQGMIDLVSDETKEVSSALYDFLTHPNGFGDPSVMVRKVNKERIVSVRPLGNDKLVSFTAESVGSYTKVSLFSLSSGKMLTSRFFGEYLTAVNVLDETHIGACCNAGVYLLEVTE